jgi:hypothetical protein
VYSESCKHGSEGREGDISKTLSFTRLVSIGSRGETSDRIMSIIGNLIEVPPGFLDLFKVYPEARSLYYRASNSRRKSNIGSISSLSTSHREIVRELYPNDRHRVGQIWNLDDCKSVSRYKTYWLEEYLLIKEDIPEIVEYGKIAHHLWLGQAWHLISFLFSGIISMEISELFIWDQKSIGINPILFRKNMLEVGDLVYYYLEIDEVKTLSKLIQDFADEIICENLKHVINEHASIHWVSRYGFDIWEDNSWLLEVNDLCNSVKDFYFNVADRENSVLISIH